MPLTTEQDLLGLIDAATQENSALEYKACAALENTEPRKNELSKDVSAFANSGGGELIYGVLEQDNIPTGLDTGFDPAGPIKREWIEQVIGSRIKPKIQDIVIRPIALTGPNAGRFAYVLEIPQSHTAHQAADKKYYKRRNFIAEAMEDYEIRDVLNRAKTPLLRPRISAHRNANPGGDVTDYWLKIVLHNEGDVSARRIRFELGVPLALLRDNGYGQTAFTDVKNRRDGRHYDERRFIYQKQEIIFPQQEVEMQNLGLGPPGIRVTNDTFRQGQNDGVELQWLIYADDMPRQQGQITMFPDLLDL